MPQGSSLAMVTVAFLMASGAVAGEKRMTSVLLPLGGTGEAGGVCTENSAASAPLIVMPLIVSAPVPVLSIAKL